MKPRTFRKANLHVITALAMEKDKKEIPVLDVGGKPKRIIPEKTPAVK